LRAPRMIAAIAMLAVIVGVTLATTVTAEHRGMCGDGDFRPPCAMFAVGLNIYGMIGVLAVATLATLVTYAFRRRPPVLLKTASILTIGAAGAFIVPVRAAGNKLEGAVVVMMVAPIFLTLVGLASFCVLLWLGEVTGGWIARRGAPARLRPNE
jgi:hypothetical protein